MWREVTAEEGRVAGSACAEGESKCLEPWKDPLTFVTLVDRHRFFPTFCCSFFRHRIQAGAAASTSSRWATPRRHLCRTRRAATSPRLCIACLRHDHTLSSSCSVVAHFSRRSHFFLRARVGRKYLEIPILAATFDPPRSRAPGGPKCVSSESSRYFLPTYRS
jgi:hypothetical protein